MELEKLASSSIYYLMSSLPSIASHREQNAFGGVSSTGLADGGITSPSDLGHVSWDQEVWILPAILPFYPSLAKSILSYRLNTRPAAYKQAGVNGYKGLLYSWSSAATGIDVTPSYMPWTHFHLTGDISFAVRQYISMSRDKLWLQEQGGCELIKGIAQFWYSKVAWNPKTGRYEILDVTPPDGTSGSVDNSVYTNAVASLALHYSKYAACMCNIDVNTFAPYEWIHAAQHLHWEYNITQNFNPEYQDFLTSESRKKTLEEPGSVLLNYPLMWNQMESTIRKNLKLYSQAVPPNSAPGIWAILTIGWLQLGDTDRALGTFEKSYKPYIQGPFKKWTKYPSNKGPSNYLSGMGAFLQTLLYGYGGLRIHTEYLTMNPQLPPKVHKMVFRNIDYLGSQFNLEIKPAQMHLSIKLIGIYPLILTLDTSVKSYHLVRGAEITLPLDSFTIRTKAPSGCPLPEDNILSKSSSKDRLTSLRGSSAVQAHFDMHILFFALLYHLKILFECMHSLLKKRL